MSHSSPKRTAKKPPPGVRSGLTVLSPGVGAVGSSPRTGVVGTPVRYGSSSSSSSRQRLNSAGKAAAAYRPAEPPLGSGAKQRQPPSTRVPVDLSAEFLAAVMSKDYVEAKRLCEQILRLDPEYDTAKQFLPVIMKKLALDAEGDGSSESGSGSDSESDTDEGEGCAGGAGGDGPSDNNQENEEVVEKVDVTIPRKYKGSGILLRDSDDIDDVKVGMQRSSKTSTGVKKSGPPA